MNSLAELPAVPDERREIAAAVRAHLGVANLSDTKAGALIGLSQSAMSRRTNADHPFDVDELSRLGQALGKSLFEIIVMPVQKMPPAPEPRAGAGGLAYITDLHSSPRWTRTTNLPVTSLPRKIAPVTDIRDAPSKADEVAVG